MRDINKVILFGRLGADPVRRTTKNGTAVTHFSLATSRRFQKQNEQNPNETIWTEETQWHRIVTWAKQAEVSARMLKKGDSVFVEGTLKTHSYNDASGREKLSVEIYAETFYHVGSPNRKPGEGLPESSPGPESEPEPMAMETLAVLES